MPQSGGDTASPHITEAIKTNIWPDILNIAKPISRFDFTLTSYSQKLQNSHSTSVPLAYALPGSHHNGIRTNPRYVTRRHDYFVRLFNCGFLTHILKVKWYRSTFYNITILGLCNFAAPGIWGAMNSLGAGGAQKPYLVNTANALTFSLMVVSCLFSSALVRLIGIKGALIFGTYVQNPLMFGGLR